MPDWRSAAAWLTQPNKALREESVFDRYRIGTDPQTGQSQYIPQGWNLAKAAWTSGKRLLAPMTSPLGAGLTLAGASPFMQVPLAAAGVPLSAAGVAGSLKEGDYPGALMNASFMGLSALPLAMRAAMMPPPPGGGANLSHPERVDLSRRTWMTKPAEALQRGLYLSEGPRTQGSLTGINQAQNRIAANASELSTLDPRSGGWAAGQLQEAKQDISGMTRREFGKKTAQAAAGATAAVAGIRGMKGPTAPTTLATPELQLVGARKYIYGDPLHTGIQEIWKTPTGYKTITRNYMTDESYGARQTDMDLPEFEWGRLKQKLGPERNDTQMMFSGDGDQVLGMTLEDIEADQFTYKGKFSHFEDADSFYDKGFVNTYDRVDFTHPEFGKLVDWNTMHPESTFMSEIEPGASGRYTDKRLIEATFRAPDGKLFLKKSARPVTREEAAELVGPELAEHMFSERQTEAAMSAGSRLSLGSYGGTPSYVVPPVPEDWWVPSSVNPKYAPRLGRAARKMSEGGW